MANCLNSASRSPSPRFPSTWYRGGIGHCRHGRPSFAIIWRGLRSEWLARQITEAFPWDSAPKYLVRDNDRAFGVAFKARVLLQLYDKPRFPYGGVGPVGLHASHRLSERGGGKRDAREGLRGH